MNGHWNSRSSTICSNVVVNPNKEITDKTFSLPAGTRFNAGENADGAPLYYSLTEKSYIVPTTIKSARTIFPQGSKIITAPLALDGSENNILFSTTNPANAPQELGWALSSPMLSLAASVDRPLAHNCRTKQEQKQSLHWLCLARK